MEQSARLLMGWKARMLEAYGLSFALIAALVDSVPLGLTSSSPTLLTAFLSFLRAEALPAGWQVIPLTGVSYLELATVASAAMAFLICYPIIAYAGIRLICVRPRMRSFAVLVVGSIALFYGGALFGLIVAHFFLLAAAQPFFGTSLPPIVSGPDLYAIIIQRMIGWALAFTAPVYLVAATEYRVARHH